MEVVCGRSRAPKKPDQALLAAAPILAACTGFGGAAFCGFTVTFTTVGLGCGLHDFS